MVRPSVARLLIAGSAVVRRRGWLDRPIAGALFTRAYFLYKRWLEDPFHDLASARPALFRGGHVLDVGANVGYTALLFARRVDPGFRVYAFEPDALNHRLLVRAVGRAGAVGARVVPVASAVGDRSGSAELLVSDQSAADHRIVTDVLHRRRPAGQRRAVPLVTLDAFTRQHGVIDQVAFVKVDVQGYEPAVLAGMRELLTRSPRAVVALEYDPATLRELGFEPPALFEPLAASGYRLELWRRGHRPCPVTPSSLLDLVPPGSYADVLAIPRGLDSPAAAGRPGGPGVAPLPSRPASD